MTCPRVPAPLPCRGNSCALRVVSERLVFLLFSLRTEQRDAFSMLAPTVVVERVGHDALTQMPDAASGDDGVFEFKRSQQAAEQTAATTPVSSSGTHTGKKKAHANPTYQVYSDGKQALGHGNVLHSLAQHCAADANQCIDHICDLLESEKVTDANGLFAVQSLAVRKLIVCAADAEGGRLREKCITLVPSTRQQRCKNIPGLRQGCHAVYAGDLFQTSLLGISK